MRSSDVPVGLGEEAVEAGLVGGLGELVVDAEDGLALGDEEAGEVLGEMAALALVGEEVAVPGHGVLDHRGEFDDPWHDQMLRSPTAPEQIRAEMGDFTYFDAVETLFAKLQLLTVAFGLFARGLVGNLGGPEKDFSALGRKPR